MPNGHDQDVTPLQDLIRSVSDSGVSLEQMSIRSGGRLSRSRFGQLKEEAIKEPLPRETVEAIANGLHLPFRVVRDAMLASCGLGEYRAQDGLTILTEEARERLSPTQMRAWEIQARALFDVLAPGDKPST